MTVETVANHLPSNNMEASSSNQSKSAIIMLNSNSMTIMDDGDCARSENNNRQRLPNRNYNLQREESSSSLEFLPPEGQNGEAASFADWDPRPSSGGKRPPSSGGYRPDSSRSMRTPTPTKHIALQAPRKQDLSHEDPHEIASDSKKSIEEENKQIERHKQRKAEEGQQPQASSSHSNGCLTPGAKPYEAWTKEKSGKKEELNKTTTQKHSQASTHRSKHSCEASASSGTKPKDTAKKTEELCKVQDLEEEESEEEEKKAPNELLMEFVETVIAEEYENAQKLCKMILMYEPDNPEALKFGPLIEERLKLDEETDSSDEEDSDDDDDVEDDDKDDDDEEESEGEEDKEEEGSGEGSGETEESTEAEDEEYEDGKWMELAQHFVEEMKLQQQQLEDDI